MKWTGVIVPIMMACINLPFFPNPINIVAFCICLMIGVVGLGMAIAE